MRYKRLSVLAITAATTTALVTGCANDASSSSVPDKVQASSEQNREPVEPVFVPKPEPDEDKDVTGLRMIEKPPTTDYTGPEMYAACNITNNSDEVSDYYIEAEVTSPEGYDSKEVWFSADDVPPGKTIPEENLIGPDYDLTEWNIHFTKIDRTSNEEGQMSDDNAAYSLALVEKQVDGVPQVNLDWEVTNNADGAVYSAPSGYLFKYQIVGADESGAEKVLYTSTLKTEGLLPGVAENESGETQTGSIPMEKVVKGRNFTVSETGEVQGLSVEITDVDRITYVQK